MWEGDFPHPYLLLRGSHLVGRVHVLNVVSKVFGFIKFRSGPPPAQLFPITPKFDFPYNSLLYTLLVNIPYNGRYTIRCVIGGWVIFLYLGNAAHSKFRNLVLKGAPSVREISDILHT